MTELGGSLEPCYSTDWEECLQELGLTGPNFEHFWKDAEEHLRHYPENLYSQEVPEVEGIWMYPTQHSYPDIPPLYVYYRIQRPKIVFLGASPAWTRTDLPPSEWE